MTSPSDDAHQAIRGNPKDPAIHNPTNTAAASLESWPQTKPPTSRIQNASCATTLPIAPEATIATTPRAKD